MEARMRTITGRVDSETVAAGSKSERTTVVIKTPAGQNYVLRRQGGPAFVDEALNSLIGKKIKGHGLLAGPSFIMTDWSEL